MRILIVSQYFYPENFRINDLAIGFVEKGHDVTVLTGIPNYPKGIFFDGYGLFQRTCENYQGINIIRCPLIPRRDAKAIGLALNYISFAFFACLYGLFKVRGKFDAIFVFQVSPITVGFPAIFMKWLKNAPIFFWVLDLWPESVLATTSINSKTITYLLTSLTRIIYRNCDKVLVQSKGFYHHAKQMGVKDNQLQFFPNWAEELYAPTQPDVTIEASLPHGFRIMFAGNIGKAQDFGAILKAAFKLKAHPHIQWVIVGDGKERHFVEEQIHALGLQKTVHLIGQKPIHLMPVYFASADALLVSLKKEEIFASTIPGKIPSYLACAKPILGMLDGEGANIINEAGAGFTCNAGDSDGLASLAVKISNLPKGELASLGNHGLRYYQQTFDRLSLFKRLEKEMSQLASKQAQS